MRQLVGVVRAQTQVLALDAELHVPLHALLEPVLVPLRRLVRGREELHLHLLELERAEDEVPGGNLVSKRLADLRDPERRLAAGVTERGLEVEEDALRGLGTQVDGRAGLLDRSDGGLEHEVELARLGEIAILVVAGQLRGGVAAAGIRVLGRARARLLDVIGAKAQPACLAVDKRVGEAREVTGRLPGTRVLDDRRVEGDDVVALLDHRLPPGIHHVVLQEHAVVPVVVGVGDAPVDLGGGKDEPAALAKRDDLVHGDHRLAPYRRVG